MEFKQINRFIIAFVALFLCISFIQESYAKYLTNASASTNINVARWSILVNGQDVVNNADFSSKVEPVFPGNDYVASGIIAPLSEGYFDLVVDHSKVDVAFNQKISLSLADDNTISDLAITGYSINGGVVTNFTGAKEINQTFQLSNQNKVNTYRIYVKWLDGTNETMDNEADTNATKTGKASIKADVLFVQNAN